MSVALATEQPAGPGGVDVTATPLYAEHRWPAVFAALRRSSPVDYCPASFYGPYWSVTRYADIVHVEALPELFSSDWKHGGVTVLEDDHDIQLPMFIAMDRPRHTVQRRAVAPAFGPSELQRLAGVVRGHTAAVLDSLPVGEPFDWVSSVSTELTTQMLATLFDFPWDDRRLLAQWANWAGDFRAAVSPALRRKRRRNLEEMAGYFGRLWRERLDTARGPDLISRMIHSEGMARMRPQEFTGNLMLLLIGGTDTTRHSMTGLIVAMNRFPNQWHTLTGEPALIPNTVSEVARWQTPLAHMRRTATADTELRGQRIAKGDKVVLWYNSANRDEAVFPDGEQFDVRRTNARRHLSFGYGIHRCVGARLAELQLSILIEEMLARGIEVETLHEPMRLPSPFSNGYRRQMVRLSRR